MNRKKQLLLGTAATVFGLAALPPQSIAGDERALSLSLRSADTLSLEQPRHLSPAMKRLIGEDDGAGSDYVRHTFHDDFEDDGSGKPGDDYGGISEPDDFETEEFKASVVLEFIEAEAAYEQGIFGEGVTVGIVDGVFDVNHPDLEANIVSFDEIDESNATDAVNPDDQRAARIKEQLRDQFKEQAEIDHGTPVSGVVAAIRNGDGMHGVAPEAKIVAVDVEALDVINIKDVLDKPEQLEEIREAIEEEIRQTLEKFDNLSEEEQQKILKETEVSNREELADDAFSTSFALQVDIAAYATDDPNTCKSEFVSHGDGIDDPVTREEGRRFFDLAQDGNVYLGSSNIDQGLMAEGIQVAVDRGSQVINMSLGKTEEEWADPVQEAIFRATDAGRIVVLSGGNESRTDDDGNPLDEIPETDFSNQLVVDSRANGLALAVGVVDENNEIQFNNCGKTKEQCLVAPGVDVLAPAKGGGTDENTGSSFAAPTVSGSLALLLDRFPTISPRDAVEILLTSTTDLGEEGVDEVFGHGLVNIERAMQPIGVASLPGGSSIHGKVATLASSRIGLGGAFGDSLSRMGALQKGLFLDGFRRPFKADLSDRVVADTRGINFEEALVSSAIETKSFTSGAFTTSFSLRDDDVDDVFGTPSSKAGFAEAAYEDEGELRAMSFRGEIADGLTMKAGHNLTAGQQLAVDPVSDPASNLFLFTEDSLNPQHGFLGKGSGVSVTHQLSGSTALSVGMMSAEGQGESDKGEGFTTQADLRHQFANEIEVGVSFSFIGEGAGFLGSEVGGAFADQAETNSQFLTLSGGMPVTESIDLLGSVTMGRSDLSGVNGGIVDDVDNVTTSAFAMGLTKDGIFDDKDRFGLIFSQPLRVESGGKATFLVPTSVNADGSIETTRERAGLTPSGRELNLQFAYSRKLSDTMGLTTYALMRDEPGHNASAETDYGVGMRFKMNF